MATAIMKQKGVPEMDDVEEIISKISEDILTKSVLVCRVRCGVCGVR